MILIDEEFLFLEKDLNDYLRLFDGNTEREVKVSVSYGDRIFVNVEADGLKREFSFLSQGFDSNTQLKRKRLLKRYIMASVYRTLKELTGRVYPYGAFTGIRPTKQYYQILEEGLDPEEFFIGFLDFKPEKFNLVKTIIESQKQVYSKDPRGIDVYVGIPFCHGRCSYCSFVSCDIDKAGELEEPYVNALLKELEAGKRILREGNWQVRALYVGGGTPSAISKRNIARILDWISQLGAPKGVEFSFEAGRPDSIDKELLDLISDYGVNRISVNPQSANDNTLFEIGRKHTFKDVVEKYDLVRNYPFSVNMDLIMGFLGETLKDFGRSVDAIIGLNPDNVTVHSLALKRGSKLKECVSSSALPETEEMSDLANSKLTTAGYLPYYMYRQKYCAGNLENTGYSKPDKVCVYNVDNMEETSSVLAFGANAISKIVFSDVERIDRIASPKDISSYVNKIDKIIEDKNIFGRR